MQVIAVLTSIVSFCSIFDDLNRYFELMSHFKFTYLIVSIVCCGLLFFYNSYKASIALLALTIVHLVSIIPWYLTPESASANKYETRLTLLHSNVLTSNTQYNLFEQLLAKETPDIVVLQEVNRDWVKGLTRALSTYKYRIEQPQNDNFGIAIYSKLPFISGDVIALGELGLPSIEVTFSLDGQNVTLLATHPIPPISHAYYSSRNEQLIYVAARLAERSGAKILVGDLNVTMWSSDYANLEAISGLNNARRGFGILPTWPANIPLLMIPIDHVLTSDHFVINNFKLGDNVGSDHLPVIVELAYPVK